MKNNCFFLAFSSFMFIQTSSAQLRLTSDSVLEKAIVQSGLIHSPLPLDNSLSYEAGGLKKKVLSRESIPCHPALDAGSSDSRRGLRSKSAMAESWTHSGLGQLAYSTEKTVSGNGSLKMSFPTFTGKRAIGSPGDRDYATYGNCRIQKNMNGENWEKFNRIAFSIYPDCEGARVVNLNFSFENADTPKKHGANRNSASHLINLKNREWNHCFLDLDEFQRDKV
ncbi:MAG: glycosyl hydrolase family 9, partial [Dysgonamonadaceae bacterium]|nr:glycosyl hydrolase family 9 [Dysgonamonadaceae bacterium]